MYCTTRWVVTRRSYQLSGGQGKQLLCGLRGKALGPRRRRPATPVAADVPATTERKQEDEADEETSVRGLVAALPKLAGAAGVGTAPVDPVTAAGSLPPTANPGPATGGREQGD